jgi:hypothetical protein
MTTSRTSPQRSIDYSAVRPGIDMQHAIQAFVGRRMSGTVSLRVIQKWFRATPPEFTSAKVDEAVHSGKIQMYRTSANRKRTGYIYETKQ